MTAHPANHLFKALTRIAAAQLPLPTWEQYVAADRQHRAAIQTRWCSEGHGYTGDGSNREVAFQLYCRACSENRASGETPRRPWQPARSTIPNFHTDLISEDEQASHDHSFDAARDAAGHR